MLLTTSNLALPKADFAGAIGSSRLNRLISLAQQTQLTTCNQIDASRASPSHIFEAIGKVAAHGSREDEMKALEPKRLRVLLCYVLALLLMAAFFIEKYRKASTGIVRTTGLAAAVLLLVGLRGRYNLTD